MSLMKIIRIHTLTASIRNVETQQQDRKRLLYRVRDQALVHPLL